MRISDWSSGVCSSDLPMAGPWLSPQVVKRKSSPKLLPAIGGAPRGRWSAASGLRREFLQQLGQLRRRLDRHHADDVVAGIDVMHFTGDAGRQVGQQIEAGAADLRYADVLAQRRVALGPLEYLAEVSDAGGGQRAACAGRHAVDPGVLVAPT